MAAIYNFPTLYKLDTFQARTITISDSESNPIDLTGASIVIEFRSIKKNGELLKRINVGLGITLSNPTSGSFQINAFSNTFPIGIAFYDCKVTIAGVTTTFFEGEIETKQNVSIP